MSKLYSVGVDWANGEDKTAWCIFKAPSRLRRLLRRIGLDKSTWERKLVKHGIIE